MKPAFGTGARTELLQSVMFVVSIFLAAVPAHPAAPQARPPNLLLVMADQLAPQQTSPYGNREVRTPHLDRLAREGIVFTAAYSNSPLCVPARSALMSGRYVSRLVL